VLIFRLIDITEMSVVCTMYHTCKIILNISDEPQSNNRANNDVRVSGETV